MDQIENPYDAPTCDEACSRLNNAAMALIGRLHHLEEAHPIKQLTRDSDEGPAMWAMLATVMSTWAETYSDIREQWDIKDDEQPTLHAAATMILMSRGVMLHYLNSLAPEDGTPLVLIALPDAPEKIMERLDEAPANAIQDLELALRLKYTKAPLSDGEMRLYQAANARMTADNLDYRPDDYFQTQAEQGAYTTAEEDNQ